MLKNKFSISKGTPKKTITSPKQKDQKRARESPEFQAENNKKQKEMETSDGKLDYLVNAMKTLTNQMNNIEKKMDRIGLDIDELKSKQLVNEDRFNSIESELSVIQQDVQNTSNLRNSMEQNLLSNQMQIVNIPSSYERRNDELLMTLNNFFNTKFTKSSFKRIVFINKRKQPNCNVILNFHNSHDKAILMENVKKLSTDENGRRIPITIDDVFEEFKNEPLAGKQLFFNNILTKLNKEILKLKTIYKHQIKFMWEQDGRILMRRNENARVVEATSIQQVEEYAKIKN